MLSRHALGLASDSFAKLFDVGISNAYAISDSFGNVELCKDCLSAVSIPVLNYENTNCLVFDYCSQNSITSIVNSSN